MSFPAVFKGRRNNEIDAYIAPTTQNISLSELSKRLSNRMTQ